MYTCLECPIGRMAVCRERKDVVGTHILVAPLQSKHVLTDYRSNLSMHTAHQTQFGSLSLCELLCLRLVLISYQD